MSQLENVKQLMGDGKWRTPLEGALELSKPDSRMSESSFASRLRDLKADGERIEKQSAGGHNFKYRLAPAPITMDAQPGESLQRSTETI